MIIPIFLMNRGCPHRCLFCNERLTAGDHPETITEDGFTGIVRDHLGSAGSRKGPHQIAFYGGTFTGLAWAEQRRLLELAAPFLRKGLIDGIRISTRPDEIDAGGIEFLAAFGVRAVEIGAQSLNDEVLESSGRGHTADDTVRAVTLLKKKGFQTGIHLMAGLPGDTADRFERTTQKTITLRPDMVRIHPTIVLKDTPLAGEFASGRYLPMTTPEAITLCGGALKALTAQGIPVIRLGLQTTRELEAAGAVIAGPFHPAFRTLVVSSLFLEMATSLLTVAAPEGKEVTFSLAAADVSDFRGQHGMNVPALKERFGVATIHVAADPTIPRQKLILTVGENRFGTDWSGRIMEDRTEDLRAET